MSTTSKYVRTICEIGIFAALGFVLDELQGIISKGLFINGGSIGFAMIAVLIIGYRRGWLPALLTGLIMGLLDIATSAYIIHPAQLFLDYILPYALVAVGCFSKYPYDKANTKGGKILWLVLGTVIGGLAKFLSHYLAGVIFWADQSGFAWGLNAMSPYLYCLVYNIAYIGPSIVLTAALLVALFARAPKVLEVENKEEKEGNSKAPLYVYVSVFGAAALGCFIFFLIVYIKSFYSYKDGSAIGYDFDPDSMVISLLSLFLLVLTALSYVKLAKGKFSLQFHSQITFLTVSMSLIYGIARLIRMYVKQKDPTTYWIWFGVGLFTVLVFLGLSLYLHLNKKKQINESNQQA